MPPSSVVAHSLASAVFLISAASAVDTFPDNGSGSEWVDALVPNS